jgi:hypothetical protein
MKTLLLVLMLINGATLYAQGINETGVFTEPQLSLGFWGQWQYYYTGIQYKHLLNHHFAYRLSAGYGKIEMDNINEYSRVSNDTFYFNHHETYTSVSLPMIGIATEYQHRVYKKLDWFVGMDVRIGYDIGNKDSLHTWNYYDTGSTTLYSQTSPAYPQPLDYGHSVVINSYQTNIFYLGLAPYGGIKVRWKRIAAGSEISVLFIDTTLISDHNHNNVFSIGNINERLFIDYMF